MLHLVSALEEFQALGIHFVSLTEAIDTSTPMGRMVFMILGAVAELERSLIVERVNAGLSRAKREGKTLGRPRLTSIARRSPSSAGRSLPAHYRWQASSVQVDRAQPADGVERDRRSLQGPPMATRSACNDHFLCCD